MLIFYNPHVDDFLAKPLIFKILGRKPLKKYGFLFEELHKANQKINILVDATASSVLPERLFHKLPFFFRALISKIELSIWKRLNNFNSEFCLIHPKSVRSADIIIAFSYKAATGNFGLRRATLLQSHAVIFHLSHYHISTFEKSRNISSLPNVFLAGDSDITDNFYFRKYFSWYDKSFLVLPFAVSSRFKLNQSWIGRDNSAVATGSFHDLRQEMPARRYKDFLDTAESTSFHPMREEIFAAKESLRGLIDSRVTPFRTYTGNFLMRFFLRWRVAQKKYFSVNIVDLYNNHKFSVIGEELTGFPALGSLESMACGTVLLAQAQYYKGLGLRAGRHFIAYEGGLSGLTLALAKAQHQDYSAMSIEGERFVRERFSSRAMFDLWIERCNSLE